jgi:hypothetical protein
MNVFTLNLNDETIWNYNEFVQFLVDNQGQDIAVSTNAEGVCLTHIGVYALLDMFKFSSVTIITANEVESHSTYTVTFVPNKFKFLQVPADADYSKYHGWNQSTVFGAFYNRPTWTRIGFAGHLLAKYPEVSTVNFRQDPADEDQRRYFEMDKLFQAHPESVNNFMSVHAQLPQQLETSDGYIVGVDTKTHTDQLAEFYPDFLFDVVAETFITGRSFFPTEKTVRPMLLKKPFIVMAPRNFLIHLRQLGFRTFHDVWDEGYDGHEGQHRYIRMLDLIDTLANKSVAELDALYNHITPILEHNHNLLKERLYSTKVTYIE